MSVPRVQDLRGLWRRSLIEWADGRRDTTTRVRWLQGSEAFVDLRQPAALAQFSHARCMGDLSIEDCVQLCAQEGFAGQLRFDGRHFEWLRLIDFQAPSATADAGSLEWLGDTLIERGRDAAYVEHWHRDDAALTAPCLAMSLRCRDSGVNALLVTVGGLFMFARDRASQLPAQRTLRQCVDGAASVQSARLWVDCEISIGSATRDGWLISASTLPYRRGCLLGQRSIGETLTTQDRNADGSPRIRRWEILQRAGEAPGW